ncbi:MAG: hypothetical protein AAFV53_34790 [Myxococcota bacterium]
MNKTAKEMADAEKAAREKLAGLLLSAFTLEELRRAVPLGQEQIPAQYSNLVDFVEQVIGCLERHGLLTADTVRDLGKLRLKRSNEFEGVAELFPEKYAQVPLSLSLHTLYKTPIPVRSLMGTPADEAYTNLCEKLYPIAESRPFVEAYNKIELKLPEEQIYNSFDMFLSFDKIPGIKENQVLTSFVKLYDPLLRAGQYRFVCFGSSRTVRFMFDGLLLSGSGIHTVTPSGSGSLIESSVHLGIVPSRISSNEERELSMIQSARFLKQQGWVKSAVLDYIKAVHDTVETGKLPSTKGEEPAQAKALAESPGVKGAKH